MKLIALLTALLMMPALAQEVPGYMKDGVITVTLKNGKQYTFSANEYKVVSRKASPKQELAKQEEAKPQGNYRAPAEPKRLKHIVSGEVVRSNGGLDTKTRSNDVEVRNKKELGLGLQYQYNFHGDMFMGGRVDTNGGAGLNLGVGF